MAQCLVACAAHHGLKLVALPTAAQRTRHALGNQTIKAKPLVPEFQRFVHSDVELSQPGHKMLASPLPGGSDTETPASKRVRRTYKYGVQWELMNFFNKPSKFHILEHPSKCYQTT